MRQPELYGTNDNYQSTSTSEATKTIPGTKGNKDKIRDEEISFFTSHRQNEKHNDAIDDQVDQTAAARNKNANRY